MRKSFLFSISACPALLLFGRQTCTALLIASALLHSVSTTVRAEQANKAGAQTGAQGIDYAEAVFSVQYGNKETAGENLLDIKSDGDSYEVNFDLDHWIDRKSTRLNSSHVSSSYAVFCLKKKRRRDSIMLTC